MLGNLIDTISKVLTAGHDAGESTAGSKISKTERDRTVATILLRVTCCG
jgi:hypothetical protein